MNIFEYVSYKEYVNDFVKKKPAGGRGIYRQLAEALNISSTTISQVFNGDKNLNIEQASDLADYLELSESETDYLFLLVQKERTGTASLIKKLNSRIETAKKSARKLETRLANEKQLSDEVKQTFYSDWTFSGIRMLAATKSGDSIEKISEYLGLPRTKVQAVVQFLLETQLCKLESGKIAVGPQKTHIGNTTPLVNRHHSNWRLQGLNQMALRDDNNLFYTAPMSLSKEVAETIREDLPHYIEKINKLVGPSKSEVVRCLNIDWFKY